MFVTRSLAARSVAIVIAAYAIGALLGRQDRPSAALPQALHAGGNGMFDDADGDMVPLCIELLANTDPERADSDSDGVDDFEEILTFTSHDAKLPRRPVDYAMRVLVTSTPRPTGGTDVFLHLMIRFVDLDLRDVEFQDIYAHYENEEIPLTAILGHSEIRVAHRYRKTDGSSYLFSLRMSSVDDLLQFTPCTIGVRAVMGNKLIHAGTLLMATGPDLAALLPFEDESLILQPVDTSVYMQEANPYYRGGGRVCEMTLSTLASSPAGTLCHVDSAGCRAAAGLRCSTSCPSRQGTTMVIPGGLGTITGGR